MIEVKNRIPAHPGRVKLTPVAGVANTYDMVRADEPLEEGTPVNAALFQRFQNYLTEELEDIRTDTIAGAKIREICK